MIFIFIFSDVCSQYPPDNSVTFTNISIYYNDELETNPVWTTGYEKDLCDNRANILSANSVEITWQS